MADCWVAALPLQYTAVMPLSSPSTISITPHSVLAFIKGVFFLTVTPLKILSISLHSKLDQKSVKIYLPANTRTFWEVPVKKIPSIIMMKLMDSILDIIREKQLLRIVKFSIGAYPLTLIFSDTKVLAVWMQFQTKIKSNKRCF